MLVDHNRRLDADRVRRERQHSFTKRLDRFLDWGYTRYNCERRWWVNFGVVFRLEGNVGIQRTGDFMLKRQITKAEHAALNAAVQIEYKPDSGGETFTLDATGFDDPGELKRALDREKVEKKEQKEKADAEKLRADGIQQKLDALGPDAKDKLKDITVLEKSWQTKLTDEVGKRDTAISALNQQIEKLTVNKASSDLASKLAGANAPLLEPHVKTRLKLENNGSGDPIIRVLDANGLPSASSLTDLENEFRKDVRYKAVIVASQASGGGAAGGNGSGNGGGAAGGSGEKKFKDLSTKERVEFFERDPIAFNTAAKASQREFVEAAAPKGRVY